MILIELYVVGAAITFATLLIAEIEAQKDPDNEHWIIGLLAVTGLTAVWPLTWAASIVATISLLKEMKESEKEDE